MKPRKQSRLFPWLFGYSYQWFGSLNQWHPRLRHVRFLQAFGAMNIIKSRNSTSSATPPRCGTRHLPSVMNHLAICRPLLHFALPSSVADGGRAQCPKQARYLFALHPGVKMHYGSHSYACAELCSLNTFFLSVQGHAHIG